MSLQSLARLSELRLQAAERVLAAARHALAIAEQGILDAQAAEADLARRLDTQRDTIREAFVGSSQARVAVEEMLREFQSFDAAIAAAAERTAEAIATRDAAKPPVAEARTAVLKADTARRKRVHLVTKITRDAARVAELTEAAEAEEQWASTRQGGNP
ncbi:MAG: hypothetical protein AAGA87_02505 [Pseudomonadota bacterium]